MTNKDDIFHTQGYPNLCHTSLNYVKFKSPDKVVLCANVSLYKCTGPAIQLFERCLVGQFGNLNICCLCPMSSYSSKQTLSKENKHHLLL